ncbi:hypothetical protein BD414DRAFT_473915 [Trametes punicea]|nr:hypothetical protein BD414DRAFT_473915 [Trametes punicea]
MRSIAGGPVTVTEDVVSRSADRNPAAFHAHPRPNSTGPGVRLECAVDANRIFQPQVVLHQFNHS